MKRCSLAVSVPVRGRPAGQRFAQGHWSRAACFRLRRLGVAVGLCFSLLVGGVEPAGAVALPQPMCFPQTGFCLEGPFLVFWLANGGLALNGYPLSAPFLQVLEDGNTYTVQYLERVRLELHPEKEDTYLVLLGQFGRRFHPPDPPVSWSGKGAYFAETGHNVEGQFLAYWQAHGGLRRFGLPLTEQFQEQLENGATYTVQYFERARFELHPEQQPPYDVLLGQFGRRALETVRR